MSDDVLSETHPILFSAPMIRALLEGRKTQTRRIYKGRNAFWKGDRLWVREAYYVLPAGIAYVADGGHHYGAGGRLRPSIHMFRAHSRITLTVTEARVNVSLHSISEEDAMEEGVDPILVPPDGGSQPHVEGFRDLWEKLHGKGSWEVNPWISVYKFSVEKGNIDEVR